MDFQKREPFNFMSVRETALAQYVGEAGVHIPSAWNSI
jgi:hypothetical protein